MPEEITQALENIGEQQPVQTEPEQVEQPIEKTFTQSDVDRIVKERLARAKKEDAESAEASKEAEKRIADLEKELASMKHANELSAWAAQASKETGVPANIIKGDTLEEMQAHAQAIKDASFSVPSLHKQTAQVGNQLTAADILAIKDPVARRQAIAQNTHLF